MTHLPIEVQSPDQVELAIEALQEAATHPNQAPTWNDEVAALIDRLPTAKRTQSAAWEALAEQLDKLRVDAPVVHVTLAARADTALRVELTGWFREHSRPDTLVVFHSNPDIAGGLVVRTTNQIHDWSFRQRLLDNAQRIPAFLAERGSEAHG